MVFETFRLADSDGIGESDQNGATIGIGRVDQNVRNGLSG